MAVDITELVMLRYHIDEFNRKISVLQNERNELIKKLERKCTHPTTATTRDYIPGGYDYVSSVIITTKCTLCNKVTESYDDPKHRGNYG